MCDCPKSVSDLPFELQPQQATYIAPSSDTFKCPEGQTLFSSTNPFPSYTNGEAYYQTCSTDMYSAQTTIQGIPNNVVFSESQCVNDGKRKVCNLTIDPTTYVSYYYA